MKGKFSSSYLPSKKNNHAALISLSCFVEIKIILVTSLCFRRDPERNSSPTPTQPHTQLFVGEEAGTWKTGIKGLKAGEREEYL